MKQYDKRILNYLLNTYERSVLFTGENKSNRPISFPFSPKTMPEYFDESSTDYEEIHGCVGLLEQKGYIQIIWQKGREGHIIQRLKLQLPAIPQIYTDLKRTPKAQLQKQAAACLKELQEQYETPVAASLVKDLRQRIEEGKSAKEYMELDDPEGTRQLVKGISAIEANEKEVYIREFSVAHFSDSKKLESLLPLVTKAFRTFEGRFEGWDVYDILAEYSIYHTPNFVYMKGAGELEFGRETVALDVFRQGIGISGQDLRGMRLRSTQGIKKVMTIENLTTFFRWQEPESLIIYLGGYLNAARRDLLKAIYEQLPQARYFHFGDIDVGGFAIYEDLCRRTGIPFDLYHMDLETLKGYAAYARPLTENDQRRLLDLRNKQGKTAYSEVLAYMLDKKIKLEQECIVRKKNV